MGSFSFSTMRAIKAERVGMLRGRMRFMHERSRHGDFGTIIAKRPAIIAEVKKSSPSHGAIRTVDPVSQARLYQQGGASAVSVLTEEVHFAGSFDDLRDVADTVSIPVLCKDFILYREQIDIAYRCGADAVLLIAKMLTGHELVELYDYALHVGCTPLVEVHHARELPPVLALNPPFIMVNQRNLESLMIEPAVAMETLNAIPEPIITICASAIETADDIRTIMRNTRNNIFLVGTSIMKADDPVRLLRELADVC